MGNFNGTLNSNEVFAGIFNMIISQEVFADNIAGTLSDLVDEARVDGSMYGDTKLYYATKPIFPENWLSTDNKAGLQASANSLLALSYADDPECQSITIDVFKQIRLSVDNYLSKRAWATEGAFSQFVSVMLGWIRDSKRIYDATLYNTFIGTEKTDVGKQHKTITLPTSTDKEAENRLQAQFIANTLADLFTDLEDISEDYNDYGILRSYAQSDFIVVWNAAFANKITYMDLPTIFHDEKVRNMLTKYRLPSHYFGTVNASSGTTGASNTTVYALKTKVYGDKQLFAGQLLPSNCAYGANETYTVNDKIICKVFKRGAIPIMSGFEVGTQFFNPRSLTETHYLTWGHNTLERLLDKPFVTIEAAGA